MGLLFAVSLFLPCLVWATPKRLGFQYIQPPLNHYRHNDIHGTLRDQSLPLLHLPYATYRAASYDELDDVYTFTNIRFAAPPTGERRFKAPQRPFKQLKIQDGSMGYSCYQSVPTQFLVARPALEGITQSEDCLFLDLFVPGYVVRASYPGSHELPIGHWIFGGGFVMGLKELYPGGTFLRESNNSMIYVRSSYRLGAFGWLAGPSFAKQGGLPNAGLHDQLAAMKWIEKYAPLFGGDPNKVTVMGESAGGSSIMHHLTANGGNITLPFQKAVIQSPAFFPQYDPAELDLQYRRFLESAGCPWEGGLECLQKRSPRVLQMANQRETARAEWGKFTFGPAVDGVYVQDLPGRELLNGHHVKNISILQGHNEEEGLIFVDPALMMATDRDTRITLRKNLPLAPIDVLRKIRDMYPRPCASNGEYAHQFDRVNAIIEDWIFNCNTRYIANAFGNETYNYRYSIRPSIHAADLFLTFIDFKFDWYGRRQLMRLPYAQIWQSYLVSFIKYGDPNIACARDAREWKKTGDKMEIIDLRWDGIRWDEDDQVDAERCAFWQRAEYAPL